MPADAYTETILPEPVRRPWILLLVWIIPQAILLLLNLHAYDLASGEFEKNQQTQFLVFLAIQAALLLGGAGLMGGLLVKRKMIHWLVCIPVLALHIGFLWLAAIWITDFDGMLPQALRQWILPPQRLLFYQFCFIMPAGFYAGLRMACFPMRMARGKDLGVSLALAIGIPVCWYLIIHIGSAITRKFWDFPDFFGVLFFIMITITTVIVLAAIVRALALLYMYILGKGRHGMMVLTVVVGVAMPIGGLWLNHAIPFPFDFQSPVVYVMALVNGLVLLLPVFGRPQYDRSIWLAQALMFPFTLYFFLVFLPFLPLSLPAMIVFGAGFLILAPLALFIIHSLRLTEGFKRERNQLGLVPAGAMLLVAVLIWPGLYTARGLLHRQVIHKAIAYVYEKDPGVPQQFDGSRGMLKITLQNLKDLNSGFELPFLTSYYSWLVFDGLVLPDSKMQHIHRVFFGESLEEKESGPTMGALFGKSSRSRGGFNRLNAPPPTGVILEQIEVTTDQEDGAEKAVATLTMKNPSSQLSEFVTTIQLPPGVHLSGYWLYVGDERVPGRIFEKKTAMWVYKMIRDSGPRDPGLLVYQKPGEVELRVYPFNANDQRVCEIEFLYPAGFAPEIMIGTERLALQARPEAPPAVASRIPDAGWHVAVSPAGQGSLPRHTRKPYLHFILDRSVQAETLEVQFQHMQAAAKAFTDEDMFALITAANYEQILLTPEPVPLSELKSALFKQEVEALPVQGGFFEGRMVQAAMLEYERRCSDPEEGPIWSRCYPVVISLASAESVPVGEGDLEYFSLIAPEAQGYWRAEAGGKRSWMPFIEGEPAPALPMEVALFRAGPVYRAGAFSGHDIMSVFVPGKADQSVEVVDAQGQFSGIAGLAELSGKSRYAQGAQAWLGYLDSVYRSDRSTVLMPSLVALSRSTGILLPVTSYIVVENTAQWKILEQKERQTLDNQSALEFMNTPEPSFWILLLGFLVFMKWRGRKAAGLSRAGARAGSPCHIGG